MSEDEIAELDECGFIWDRAEYEWQQRISALLDFKASNGHCRVPQKYVVDGLELGAWVSRCCHEKAGLEDWQKVELTSLGLLINKKE